MTGRDPSPAASFNEPPTFVSGAFWALRTGVARGRSGPAPDLFARLRARRAVRVRLAVTALVGAAAVVLLVTLTALGLSLVVVAVWSAAIELMLLVRLTRSIDEAWVDLALPPR